MDDEEAELMLPGPEPSARQPLVVGDGGAAARAGFEALGLGCLDELFERHRVELRAHVMQLLAAAQGSDSPASLSPSGGVRTQRWAPLAKGELQPWRDPTAPKLPAAAGDRGQGWHEVAVGGTVAPSVGNAAPLWPSAQLSEAAKMAGIDFADQATDLDAAAGGQAPPERAPAPGPKEPPAGPSRASAGSAATAASGATQGEYRSSDGNGGSGWNTRRKRISIAATTERGAARILHSPAFDTAVGLAVLCSALIVGLDVEYCARQLVETPPVFFRACLYVFCVIFCLELGLRLFVEKMEFFKGKEWAWNCFDTFTVFLNVCEVIMLSVWPSGRPLLLFSRLVRIVRIVRVIRIFRVLVQLKLMVYSIMSTLKSLLWSLVLMCLFAYLCSVCLTQAATHHLVDLSVMEVQPEYAAELRDNWGSLTKTGYTLFKSVMGGVSWGEPLRSLLKLHWIYFLVFVVYISFTLFAFFNVMTGFFCENALELANEDKELVIQEQLKNKARYIEEFQRLFSTIDEDGSGELSYQEFADNLQSEELKAYFQHLRLDIERAQDIFRLLDKDMSGSISVIEFVEGCLQLRGAATKIDIATVGYEVMRLQSMLSSVMGDVTALGSAGSGGQRAVADALARDSV